MGSLPGRCSVAGVVALLAAMTLPAASQVFVVGEKTAEADVTTDFHPTHVELPTQLLSEAGYQDLLRNLESEQGFAHRELPLGAGFVLVANGNLSPRGEEYKQMLYRKGQAAGPGDRVAITSLKVDRDRIIIDINGGPYAKHRFLSHISLNDMALAPQGPLATGARVTLVFEGGVPDITASEVKALLDPIIDFRARSASEAYANSMPPVVRDAIEGHRVLVGMDQRMVLASVGAPKSKDREHTDPSDPNSPVLEEWIYGETPTPIQFVRFRDGRVVRLEIAAIGKPIEVHDKNELGGIADTPVLQARTILNGDEQRLPGGDLGGRRPPTLAKPGEVLDAGASTMGRVLVPGSPGSQNCNAAPVAGKTTSASSSPTSTAPSTASASTGSPGTSPATSQPSATSPTSPAAAPSTSASSPCPQTASRDDAARARQQPSIGSGPIGLPSTGLPGDDTASGMGGIPGSVPGASQGGPGGSMPGSIPGSGQGLPGQGMPYPPGTQPTLPGSNIPMGPNHAAGSSIASVVLP